MTQARPMIGVRWQDDSDDSAALHREIAQLRTEVLHLRQRDGQVFQWTWPPEFFWVSAYEAP